MRLYFFFNLEPWDTNFLFLTWRTTHTLTISTFLTLLPTPTPYLTNSRTLLDSFRWPWQPTPTRPYTGKQNVDFFAVMLTNSTTCISVFQDNRIQSCARFKAWSKSTEKCYLALLIVCKAGPLSNQLKVKYFLFKIYLLWFVNPRP